MTSQAEAALKWNPSLYWYVGSTSDQFGSVAVMEWNPPTALDEVFEDGSICPFDTGSLAASPMKFDPGCPDGPAYVLACSSGLNAWHDDARQGLCASYDDICRYIDGEPPSTPTTGYDHALATDDSRAWTWEARLAKSTWMNHVGPVSEIYWSSATDEAHVQAEILDRFVSGARNETLEAYQAAVHRSRVCPGATQHDEIRADLKARLS